MARTGDGLLSGRYGTTVKDGTTSAGIPVYNVSAPALSGKPYRIIEL